MYNHHAQKKYSVAFIAVLAAILIVSLLSTMVRASSVVGVSSNIADVPGGADLVLTVRAQNDGDVAQLEVDTSLPAVLPDFSVYANEANPYGSDASLFSAAGVTVTYSAAQSQWVIDFGQSVTDIIRNNGGKINFYLVLKDVNGVNLWGSMNLPAPDSTFGYDLVEGTGDTLALEAETEVENDDNPAVVPGVPNTSSVQ